MHPDDVAHLADRPEPRVTLVGDPAIERGGCVLEAGPTIIDAQLGSALDRARSFLESGSAS
jgi:flagellar assembly protein FliH